MVSMTADTTLIESNDLCGYQQWRRCGRSGTHRVDIPSADVTSNDFGDDFGRPEHSGVVLQLRNIQYFAAL
jgi:hypothetical protein